MRFALLLGIRHRTHIDHPSSAWGSLAADYQICANRYGLTFGEKSVSLHHGLGPTVHKWARPARGPIQDPQIDQLLTMTITAQITPEMIEELDEFLNSDQAPSDCMGISDLDGFLAGIVAGPERIVPSEWLPVIWQGGEPEFKDTKQAERIIGIIMARHNEIIREFDNELDEYHPILWRAPDGSYRATDWCEGFIDAIELRVDAWQPILEVDTMIMHPIMAHLQDSDGEPILEGTPEQISEIRRECTDILPEVIQLIYDFWKSLRSPSIDALKSVKHGSGDIGLDEFNADIAKSEDLPCEPRWDLDEQHSATATNPYKNVGRNDPCPCGSGKKFKRCCRPQ